MLFVCYPKCTTCKKAEKWLQDQGLEFENETLNFRTLLKRS